MIVIPVVKMRPYPVAHPMNSLPPPHPRGVAVVLQISNTCCNHETSPNACFSCFKQFFPFLLGGENMYTVILLNPLPFLFILLDPLPILVASFRCAQILREILSFTRSLMINARQLLRVSKTQTRKAKQFCVCRGLPKTSRLLSIQYLVSECIWFCNVTPNLYRETVTQHTLR